MNTRPIQGHCYLTSFGFAFRLAAMVFFRKFVAAAILCVLAAQAWAEPTTTDDALTGLMAKRGLLANLDDMRQNVGHSASQLVVYAMGFLGVPYARGGESYTTGFDCSGFVRTMYEQSMGLVLPRKASEQAKATFIIDKSELKPGDLVFFNTLRRAFSHVGIYVGDGKFIHSPRTGSEVRVEDMNQSYWQKRFNGARRVETDAASVAPAP